MTKKVKTENADMISDLHDSILTHILSFLPTKEAVKTSVLSTRWRNIFTLVSNLDFDLDESTSSGAKRIKLKSFKYFADKFFENATIENFRLKSGRRVDCIWLHRWISGAVSRDVNHLDLNISLSKFTLLGFLLTCNTLVTLKLEIHFVSNVANDVCLPNLKILHLKPKKYSNNDSVKSLVSSCISLEDLVLENCTMKKIDISHDLLKRLTILSSIIYCSSVVIDTPALAYFKYRDHVAGEYSLKNLESLVEADVDLIEICRNKQRAEATSFFKGIINAQSLSFRALELLGRCQPPPISPKLVRMKIWGLVDVLKNSYQLEELVIERRGKGLDGRSGDWDVVTPSLKKCLSMNCLKSR